MINGCASGPSEDAKPWPYVAVDTASIRCPEVSPSDRAESRRYIGPPVPDVTDAQGRLIVSDDAKRKKFDEFRVAVARKNAALKRSHADQDVCRGSTQPTS